MNTTIKKKIVVVDIDGTVSKVNPDRLKFITGEKSINRIKEETAQMSLF
jgi:hypothetical protein